MPPDAGRDEPPPGGCRSLLATGCLLGFGGVLLAILAVIAVIVVLVRLVVFAWSFL
jgi:hypothetical protein